MNELVKETITLTQNLGKENTQVLLEGDIIVSDAKPDMAVILKTDARAHIERLEVTGDRISFSGKLHISVLYLAKASDKPIHSMSFTMPIDDFIHMEGVTRDMWVDVTASISNFEYKMVNDRKINYRAVIDVCCAAENKVSHDIVVSVDGLSDSHLKKNKLGVNRTVESKEDRIQIKNDLPLPPGKPNIRTILQSDATISNKEVKVTGGRVSVSGEMLVSTLYCGEDDGIVEFVEHEMPFNGYIDAVGAREGMIGDVQLRISNTDMTAEKDDDGEDRVIRADITVMATVKVYSQGEVTFLDDAYYINKNLNFTRENVKIPRLICRNKNQCPIKDIIQLDDDCPDILQIFQVTGDLMIEGMKLFEDRITVEGIIKANILYIAKNDDSPLYNYTAYLPFRQTIEAKGALPHMDAVVDHSIDHIGFNMLSNKEVEVRYLVCFTAKVVDDNAVSVITDIQFDDMDRSVIDMMPSVSIYVVQEGDSLWSIAKRYNTSLDDLVDINELDSPELIVPGQKLLVLKKVSA